MSKVIIKTVKRKTTIPQAVIDRAAKIAYSKPALPSQFPATASKPESKSNKAA